MNLDEEFKNIIQGQKKILDQLDLINKSVTKRDEIYSVSDLAKMFKVTERTIFNWKERVNLPVTIVGSKTYVTEKQLLEFLEKNEVKSVKK